MAEIQQALTNTHEKYDDFINENFNITNSLNEYKEMEKVRRRWLLFVMQ